MDRRQSPNRAGFTLVEVLVAILIIALLVAILLPAVQGAFKKAKEAQVSAELTNLATSLASFKTTYGDYPPSRIVLAEQGFNNITAVQLAGLIVVSPSGNDIDISPAALIQRSKLYLRRFWSRVDFDNAPNSGTPQGFDFNGNGTTNDPPFVLSGSECLVFFLGGIPQNVQQSAQVGGNKQGFGLAGFSKLPTNPFLTPNPALVSANNRTIPHYDFNASRLIDLDGDGIPSYIDPLDTTPMNQRAYAYFASYGTNSYDPNDVNGLGKHLDFAFSGSGNDLGDYEHEDDYNGTPQPYVERGFTTTFPAGAANTNYVVSPGPNPYCTSTPVPTTGSVTWINPNSFQLFSAGQDRFWGLGGSYVQNSLASSGALPIAPGDTGIINGTTATIQPNWNDFVNNIRAIRESDNLTNFSGGRLN